MTEAENITLDKQPISESANKQACTETHRNKLIDNTKESVERLMTYAVKTPDIELSIDFLNAIVPLLRKESAEFTTQDEITLWASYQQLTYNVKPATDCSLAITNQLNARVKRTASKHSPNPFKFWQKQYPISEAARKSQIEIWLIVCCLILSIFFYIIIQSYCAALSTALTNTHNIANEWHAQQKQFTELQQIYSQNNTPDNKAKLEDLKFNMALLNNRFAASLRIIILLNQPIIVFLEKTSLSEFHFGEKNCHNVIENAQNPTYLTMCNIFHDNYASLLYTLSAQYLLPLILGIVGATSYLVRDTLAKLENNSFLPCTKGKIIMRICLGALLGVISGIFIEDESIKLEDFNLNLVLLSLIMGYSVEVAFSLFDQIVDRMKSWTNSLNIKSN